MQKEKIISFKEGIPGFEYLKEFVLLQAEDSIFCYLQSVEEKRVSFVIVDPYVIKKDYEPKISETYFAKLGGGNTSEFAIYVIATLGEKIENITINLQAPILIHTEKREGVQAIVEDKKYTSKTKLVDLLKERN